MRNQRISREEQLRLIHECRTSGLSDNQWCIQHGIRSGTFYTWVSRNKKRGDVYIPSPGGAAEYFPEAKQDIVRINLVREDSVAMTEPEGPARQLTTADAPHPASMAETGTLISSSAPVMELELNGARLRISNEIDPGLLTQVLQMLRNTVC